MRDKLPLVMFTLLAQAGVGLYLVAGCLGKAGLEDAVLRWTLALTAVGMAISLLHLGSPLGAYRALGNLKSSWLSREIACLGVFFTLVWSEWIFASAMGPAGGAAVGWLAFGAGALGLFSMAAVYAHTAIPAWSGWHTHNSFHSAAIVAGAALYSTVAITGGQAEQAMRGLLIVAAGTGLQLAGLAAYLPALAGGGAADRASARLLAACRPWLAIGQGLTIAGGFGLPLAIGLGAVQGEAMIYGAFLLTAAGQLIGRSLFYATGVHAMLERY